MSFSSSCPKLLPGTRSRFFSFLVNPASRLSTTSLFRPGPEVKGHLRSAALPCGEEDGEQLVPRPPPSALSLSPLLGFESTHLPFLPLLPPSSPHPSLPASACPLLLKGGGRIVVGWGLLRVGGGVAEGYSFLIPPPSPRPPRPQCHSSLIIFSVYDLLVLFDLAAAPTTRQRRLIPPRSLVRLKVDYSNPPFR